MNRILITAIIFFIFICRSNFVSAQIEKGNYILGGTAGVENITSANLNTLGYNTTTLSVSAMYGKFLTDHFLIGADANVNYRFYTYSQGYTVLKAGPLLRYYFNNIFLQADYNFGIPSTNYTEHDLFIRVGYAYFLNDFVAIEPYLFVGYRDIIYRGITNYAYLDEGMYFSIQVYLESTSNKALKLRKSTLKRNP